MRVMTKKKKIAIFWAVLVFLAVLCIGGFLGYKCYKAEEERVASEIFLNHFDIKIKDEYTEEFFNQEFTLETFWKENIKIESIRYVRYAEGDYRLTVYLQKEGLIYFKRAIRKTKKLYFVEDTVCVGVLHMWI